MTTTALIPAYNEAATVAAVVKTALEAGCAVVVADDGSSDATAQIAAQAGAKVVRLAQNGGKGAALVAGLAEIGTPYTLMLDADLVGLTPQHIQALLQPVHGGQLDMSIGVFKSGGLMSDFGNRATPFLSGQRACKTDWLRSVPDLEQRWPEPPITAHLERTQARWSYVELVGASQVLKEQKRGLWAGLRMRLKMYADILRYRMGKN